MSLSHLSDSTLRAKLSALVATDRSTTAQLLAHLAEFDSRRLYADDGFPSMFGYCVQCLRFSEEVAFKRIRAARAARRFPVLLDAIAEGRLHLTAVVLLAPHLKPENISELLCAATHRTKAQIEQLLAERLPQSDLRTIVRAIPTPPAPVICPSPATRLPEPGREPVCPAQHEVDPDPPRVPPSSARVAPLAPQRFALQVTIAQETHDKLRRLQDLLGHSIPSGDVAQILDRAFDALLARVERAKCGAVDRPRRIHPKPSANPRHVPAHVKRAVWARDGGRCTFVSDSGRRCSERRFLEYDHVVEVARGGQASVGGVRLLCRTHNQLSAERTFGVEFMRARREGLT